MFLTLFFFCRLTLLQALTASKLVNSASALAALASFGAQGQVSWRAGLTLALGVVAGAWVGSRISSKATAKVVRPVLVVVAVLLLCKVLQLQWGD